ncbi:MULTISPECIES: ribbon-helix-helix protein, CopG family [unclassified Nostoc]|uniref:ribbon-helix-helix protein, CopG family n=1 Tax=unclassified Nostoc TaxID=2593658 RepID=UPI000B95898B|nr:ribbon-helix-helix protein, CopG family [Nostoc sp. 'Peltigera membranacea cyanobiont' 210A]OYD95722.1 DNA-binding protein [Nostoc sp. 'Peltigera membranacea cyanobiont' 210A]
MKQESSKIRLSLDVSSELNETITQLAKKSGGSKSDILRKAIALMEVAVDAKERGEKVALLNKDQTVNREIVGI